MSFAETPPTRRISERLAPCRYFPLRSRCGGTTASARSSGRIDHRADAVLAETEGIVPRKPCDPADDAMVRWERMRHKRSPSPRQLAGTPLLPLAMRNTS